MITSRFGARVQLIAPVDWNTGWTSGRFTYPEGTFDKDVHVSELKADGGLNEIQAASDALEQHLCRDCQQPMEVIFQPQRNAEPLTVVTCKNRACSLWSVTLTTTQYALQTDEQWDAYRESVARLKAILGERS